MTLEELSAIARRLWVVWLMLLFAGIIAWAFWPRNKKKFEEQGQIPFHDDNGEA